MSVRLVFFAAVAATSLSIATASAEMLPQSDDVRLSARDLVGMDAVQLRIARKEIFARHG